MSNTMASSEPVTLTELLHCDVQARLRPFPSASKLMWDCMRRLEALNEYHVFLGLHRYCFSLAGDEIRKLLKNNEGQNREQELEFYPYGLEEKLSFYPHSLEEELTFHPRVLLFILTLLDRLAGQIAALEATAQQAKADGWRATILNKYGRVEPNEMTSVALPLRDALRDTISMITVMIRQLTPLCQTFKAYELSRRPLSALPASQQALLERVRVATQEYLNQKLPMVASTDVGRTLVAANVKQLEHLLCTGTPPPLSPWSGDLDSLICLNSRCCAGDEAWRTYRSVNEWAEHMQYCLNHVEHRCVDWELKDQLPVIMRDVAAMQEHSMDVHNRSQEYLRDNSGTWENMYTWYDTIACPLCGKAGLLDPSNIWKGKVSPFTSKALENHIREHLDDVASVMWRQADKELPGLAKDSSTDGSTDSTDSTDNKDDRTILHQLLLACDSDTRYYHYERDLRQPATLLINLLAAFPELEKLIDKVDGQGQTAIHYAAKTNLIDTVVVLLGEQPWKATCRADATATNRLTLTSADYTQFRRRLRQRDGQGRTPVQLAVMHGRFAVARAMVVEYGMHLGDHGSDADDAVKTLSWAARASGTGDFEGVEPHAQMYMMRMLLRHGGQAFISAAPRAASGLLPPLHEAAARGHNTVVRELLDAGAPVGQVSRGGWTALHLAAAGGHLDTVKMLLQQQLTPNVTAHDNLTPLHCAAVAGRETVVRLLLAAGASSLDQTSTAQWTPLHYAAAVGHTATVQALAQHDSRALAYNDVHNDAPLDLAVRYCHWSVFTALLNLSTTVATNTIIVRARTRAHQSCNISPSKPPSPLLPFILPPEPLGPLHAAVARNDGLLAEALLFRGRASGPIRVDERCGVSGLTPLFYAASAGHAVLVERLLRAGADVGLRPYGIADWAQVVTDKPVLRLLYDATNKPSSNGCNNDPGVAAKERRVTANKISEVLRDGARAIPISLDKLSI